MTTQTRNCSFDVCTLFPEFGTSNADPLPEAGEGEVIIRVPAGISLQSLRDSYVGKVLLHQQDWYEKYEWAKAPLPAGTRRIRLPIPESNKKTFVEQRLLLNEGESVPPVTLVALTLLCCQKQNLPDPLKNGWVRCHETAEKPLDFDHCVECLIAEHLTKAHCHEGLVACLIPCIPVEVASCDDSDDRLLLSPPNRRAIYTLQERIDLW